MAEGTTGLVKASEAFEEYRDRLPWRSRPLFYRAIKRGEVPSIRFGIAVFVPRQALEALADGNLIDFERTRRRFVDEYPEP